MPKISVIVPVYKVEQYLCKCIDSILAQTFTCFELILVDDGSPDNCGTICDKYAAKDLRVKVIHKENGGLSDARNAGICNAQGEYLGFVDSDDYIKPEMYEKLYESITKYSADMVICNYCYVYENGTIISRHSCNDIQVCSSETALIEILKGDSFAVSSWSKLYKKDLFNHIRFPLGILYEDAAIIIDLMRLCNKIVLDPEPLYYYLKRNDSIMNKSFSSANLVIVDIYKRNYDLIVEWFPNCRQLGFYRLIWAYRFLLAKLALCPRSVKKENKASIKLYTHYIQKHVKDIFKNPYENIRSLVASALICINVNCYFYAVKHFLPKGDD